MAKRQPFLLGLVVASLEEGEEASDVEGRGTQTVGAEDDVRRRYRKGRRRMGNTPGERDLSMNLPYLTGKL